jgi:hypothetical protein
MASNKFSPLFEIHLDSVGSSEFVVEIGPHTANNLGGGGGSSFLAAPDNIDDADSIYFYFGWAAVNGGWLIRRQVRSTSLTTDATVSNNIGILDLATGWSSREILTYT